MVENHFLYSEIPLWIFTNFLRYLNSFTDVSESTTFYVPFILSAIDKAKTKMGTAEIIMEFFQPLFLSTSLAFILLLYLATSKYRHEKIDNLKKKKSHEMLKSLPHIVLILSSSCCCDFLFFFKHLTFSY